MKTRKAVQKVIKELLEKPDVVVSGISSVKTIYIEPDSCLPITHFQAESVYVICSNKGLSTRVTNAIREIMDGKDCHLTHREITL